MVISALSLVVLVARRGIPFSLGSDQLLKGHTVIGVVELVHHVLAVLGA